MTEKVAKEAYDTLDLVLQELDKAESESINIVCDIIRYHAEKYDSKDLYKLAEVLSQWGERPSAEILTMLEDFFDIPINELEEVK